MSSGTAAIDQHEIRALAMIGRVDQRMLARRHEDVVGSALMRRAIQRQLRVPAAAGVGLTRRRRRVP